MTISSSESNNGFDATNMQYPLLRAWVEVLGDQSTQEQAPQVTGTMAGRSVINTTAVINQLILDINTNTTVQDRDNKLLIKCVGVPVTVIAIAAMVAIVTAPLWLICPPIPIIAVGAALVIGSSVGGVIITQAVIKDFAIEEKKNEAINACTDSKFLQWADTSEIKLDQGNVVFSYQHYQKVMADAKRQRVQQEKDQVWTPEKIMANNNGLLAKAIESNPTKRYWTTLENGDVDYKVALVTACGDTRFIQWATEKKVVLTLDNVLERRDVSLRLRTIERSFSRSFRYGVFEAVSGGDYHAYGAYKN